MKIKYICILILFPVICFAQFGQNYYAQGQLDSTGFDAISVDNIYEKTNTVGIGFGNAWYYTDTSFNIKHNTWSQAIDSSCFYVKFSSNNPSLYLVSKTPRSGYLTMTTDFTLSTNGGGIWMNPGGTSTYKFDANVMRPLSAGGSDLGTSALPIGTTYTQTLAIDSDSTTHDIFVGNAPTWSYMDAGDANFTTSSNRDDKENISELDNISFTNLKVYSYNYKIDKLGWKDASNIVVDSLRIRQEKINKRAELLSKKKRFGLMSDDWNDFLGREDDGKIDWNELTAYLISELVELRKKVDALEKK